MTDSDNDGKAAPTVRVVAQHRRAAPPPYFTNAIFTPDGTTVLASASDKSISTFLLPADLLSPTTTPSDLDAVATTRLAEPTQVVAPAPTFSLADPASQVFLVGCRDHPLQLHHAFAATPHQQPIQSYRLVRHDTEQLLTPASLVWLPPGSHFLCGSTDRLDYFDVTRPDGPILTLPTIPSRRHLLKGGGVGFKGTVSALAVSAAPSLVAAGSRTRNIGLYDLDRSAAAVSTWSLTHAPESIHGHGIIQLLWSPCGRYLLVNERRASNLLVYDIRGAHKLLARLAGRFCASQQRLTCDVYQGLASPGFEVWAGAYDGSVGVWDRVGCAEGTVKPAWSWDAHLSPVASTAMHACGSVVATCSGAWYHTPDGALDDFGASSAHTDATNTTQVYDESSLKIWSVATPE